MEPTVVAKQTGVIPTQFDADVPLFSSAKNSDLSRNVDVEGPSVWVLIGATIQTGSLPLAIYSAPVKPLSVNL